MKWKKILGFGDKYEVSNTGLVRSLRYNNTNSTRLLAPKKNRRGYLQVNLCYEGRAKLFSVHRLVAKAFLSDYSEDLQVNHIDGDKINNAVDNLEMCTNKQNMEHAKNHKLLKNARGEAHPSAKLNERQVREIREADGAH